MSPNAGHAFPSGTGFPQVLSDFLDRTLKLTPAAVKSDTGEGRVL